MRLPFHFIVPYERPTASTSWTPQCLWLPPSTRLEAAWKDSSTRPVIKYQLSATVRPALAFQFEPCNRDVFIAPIVRASPPIYTGPDKYSDYKLRCETRLVKHFYSARNGSLRISAQEPHPINLLDQWYKATTTVPVRIEVSSIQGIAKLAQNNWTLKVSTQLRSRLFYSEKIFKIPPTLQSVAADAKSMSSSRIVRLQEREYSKLDWRHEGLPEGEFTAMGAPASNLLTAEVLVPVAVARSCLPSFDCLTAVLRYSIIIEVRFKNYHGSLATVEVPVQVIRDPGTLKTLSPELEMGRTNSFESVPPDDHWHDVDLDLEALPRYQQ